MPVQYDFGGQVAIVTGGASGIGLALVRRLRAAGALVHVWDKTTGDEPGAIFHQIDVTKPDEIATALKAVGDQVDILVTCAGLAGPQAEFVKYPVEQFRKVMEVNFFAAVQACYQVLPLMKTRNRGRIVTVSSYAAKNGTPYMSGYSASQGATVTFSAAIAKELGKTGIRINSITPDLIKSETLSRQPEEVMAEHIESSPMGRLGTPEEVVNVVMFLVSDAAELNLGVAFDATGGKGQY